MIYIKRMTLPTSMDLTTARCRIWDTVVVGAGPAGAVAAREIARRGATVLLVDKATFPRWKVCGSCLNARALATLKAIDLGQVALNLQAIPLRRMCWATQGGHAELALPQGVAVSRERFDAALVTAAQEAGATFLPNTEARPLSVSEHCRFVSLRQDQMTVRISTRLLVVADGLGGSTSNSEPGLQRQVEPDSRLGAGVLLLQAPDYYLPGTIYMACARSGYVGLVRVEDGRLNIAAALVPDAVKQQGGLAGTAASILKAAGFPIPPDIAHVPWRGTPLLTRRLTRPYAQRMFILGDAAGYVEPFTGEGMAWALASGVAVAPLAVQAIQEWQPALGRHWGSLHRRIVTQRQVVIRAAAQVLRRPWLTQTLVHVLACWPGLAQPVLTWMNRQALT